MQIVPVCFIVGTLILQSDHKLEHSGDEGDVRRQSSELSKVAFSFINTFLAPTGALIVTVVYYSILEV